MAHGERAGGQAVGTGPAADAEQGVLFPRGSDGRRSTASTGKAVWADAVRGVDDVLGARIGQAGDWRKDYVRAVVSHTGAATRSPDGGDSWSAIVRDLPAVLSVEVQTLP